MSACLGHGSPRTCAACRPSSAQTAPAPRTATCLAPSVFFKQLFDLLGHFFLIHFGHTVRPPECWLGSRLQSDRVVHFRPLLRARRDGPMPKRVIELFCDALQPGVATVALTVAPAAMQPEFTELTSGPLACLSLGDTKARDTSLPLTFSSQALPARSSRALCAHSPGCAIHP